MGSTRLPGQVLRPLAGRPMLSRIVDRARLARGDEPAGPGARDAVHLAPEGSVPHRTIDEPGRLLTAAMDGRQRSRLRADRPDLRGAVPSRSRVWDGGCAAVSGRAPRA